MNGGERRGTELKGGTGYKGVFGNRMDEKKHKGDTDILRRQIDVWSRRL